MRSWIKYSIEKRVILL